MELVEIDKCTEIFSIRIPEVLKSDLDKLSKGQRRDLNERLLVEMARTVHSARFDPVEYLKT